MSKGVPIWESEPSKQLSVRQSPRFVRVFVVATIFVSLAWELELSSELSSEGESELSLGGASNWESVLGEPVEG